MTISTREANANAHPGNNHKRYDSQRRSADQVKADKRKATAEKAEKRARKLQGIEKAAQIEHDARAKAKNQRDQTGVSSKDALAIPRVRHGRPMVVDPTDKENNGRSSCTCPCSDAYYLLYSSSPRSCQKEKKGP